MRQPLRDRRPGVGQRKATCGRRQLVSESQVLGNFNLAQNLREKLELRDVPRAHKDGEAVEVYVHPRMAVEERGEGPQRETGKRRQQGGRRGGSTATGSRIAHVQVRDFKLERGETGLGLGIEEFQELRRQFDQLQLFDSSPDSRRELLKEKRLCATMAIRCTPQTIDENEFQLLHVSELARKLKQRQPVGGCLSGSSPPYRSTSFFSFLLSFPLFSFTPSPFLFFSFFSTLFEFASVRVFPPGRVSSFSAASLLPPGGEPGRARTPKRFPAFACVSRFMAARSERPSSFGT